MLSNRFYAAMEFLIPICHYIGAYNFTWNTKRRELMTPAQPKRIFKANIVAVLIWFTFVALKIFRYWKLKDYNFNLTFPFLIGGIIASVAIALISKPDGEFVGSTNTVLYYLHRINRLYLTGHNPNTSKFNKLLDLAVFAFVAILLSAMLVNWLPYLFFSDLPFFIGSMIPGANIIVNSILVFYHCYICIPMYGAFGVEVICIMIYGILVIPFMAKELALGRKCYATSSILRQVDIVTIEYRAAQILQILFNQLTGIILIPFQILFSIMFIATSFIVIRNRSEMSVVSLALMITWAVVFPSAWIFILMMGGYLEKSGGRILKSWKYHLASLRNGKERKYLRKFRLSCKPLSISYKTMYIIRQASAMVFVRGLLKGLMRALLAVKTN